MSDEVAGASYVTLLDSIKRDVEGTRVRAARTVNTELVGMYWRIGRRILDLQAEQGWGAHVVDRLATDLRTSFPDARGLSRRNLHYMRALARAWPEVVPQPVAQLPWGHVRTLLDRVDDHPVLEWYAATAATAGWSRAVLDTMISTRLHLRQGAAPSNFHATLAPADSELAQDITRDPYVFDFLRLQPGYRELDVQAALIAELRQLLQELGTGFAIVGERHPLIVGDSEFFPDLLCYHTRLHRYVVFELKLGRFDPRDLGQLQFYVQTVDNQLRDPHADAPTIGVLLVANRDDTVVQYALQSSTAPLAVSRYQLPDDVRQLLPADEQLLEVGRHATTPRTRRTDTSDDDTAADTADKPSQQSGLA